MNNIKKSIMAFILILALMVSTFTIVAIDIESEEEEENILYANDNECEEPIEIGCFEIDEITYSVFAGHDENGNEIITITGGEEFYTIVFDSEIFVEKELEPEGATTRCVVESSNASNGYSYFCSRGPSDVYWSLSAPSGSKSKTVALNSENDKIASSFNSIVDSMWNTNSWLLNHMTVSLVAIGLAAAVSLPPPLRTAVAIALILIVSAPNIVDYASSFESLANLQDAAAAKFNEFQ